MKIAVTGAHGKVGRSVVKTLLEHGYDVRAIIHRKSDDCPVENVVIDIVNYEQVYESLKGCDAVIHLAGIPSPEREDNTSRVFQINTAGAYNIVLASGLLGINHVAIASSDCAFGFTFAHNRPEPVYLPIDENHPDRPDNSYGISKMVSEKVCDAIAQRFPQMTICSLRISHVVDKEGMDYEKYFKEWILDPAIGSFNLWSYIDLRDCAEAFRLAIEADLYRHEVFCIAAPNSRSIKPTKELIENYYPNVELRLEFKDHESLEDSSKAEKLLGFKAKHIWNEDFNINEL